MKYTWLNYDGTIAGHTTSKEPGARFIERDVRRYVFRRAAMGGDVVKTTVKGKDGGEVEYRGVVLEDTVVENRVKLKVAWYVGTLAPVIRSNVDAFTDVKLPTRNTKKPKTFTIQPNFGPRLLVDDEVSIWYRSLQVPRRFKDQEWLRLYRARFPDEETRLYGTHIGTIYWASGTTRRSLILVSKAHVPTDIEYTPQARKRLYRRWEVNHTRITPELLKMKEVPINELLYIATNLVTLRHRPRAGLTFSTLNQGRGTQ